MQKKLKKIFPEFLDYALGFKPSISPESDGVIMIIKSDETKAVVLFENSNSPISLGEYLLKIYDLELPENLKTHLNNTLGFGEDFYSEIDHSFFFHDEANLYYTPIFVVGGEEIDPLEINKKISVKSNLYDSELFFFKRKNMLEIEADLVEIASKKIVIVPPMVSYLGVPMIKKNTLNLVQGQYGSFKSRFSSFLISMVIGKTQVDTLGFKKELDDDFLCVLIDTERNTSEELPFAIQNIANHTGLSLPQNDSFRVSSLKLITRNKRLEKLKSYLFSIRKSTQKHIFLTIDVATDIILDFNSVEETMQLLDFLGMLVENQDITIVLVIHENPGTVKARGHLGSEAWNKASNVFKIGVLKNKNESDKTYIGVDFLKNRSAKKMPRLVLKFDEKNQDFEIASTNDILELEKENKLKVNESDLLQIISELFKEPQQKLTQKVLLEFLMDHFNASKGTIITRLKSIVDSGSELVDLDGIVCFLKCHSNIGTTTYYTLEPKLSSDSEE